MILKLQDQVCSLESSKFLQHLGFPQESIFYWVIRGEKAILIDQDGWSGGYFHCTVKACEYYSAYTVAELGEFLPREINFYKDDGYTKIKMLGRLVCSPSLLVMGHLGGWYPDYKDFGGASLVAIKELKEYLKGSTEAEARAKMLIYLKENSII